MANVELRNRVKVQTATTGTGTLTLGSPVAGYKSFTDAGVRDLETVRYLIEDGAAWEYGQGVYDSGTLARTLALESSLSSVGPTVDTGSTPATKISLTGAAVVSITVGAEDFRGRWETWVDQIYMHPHLVGGPARGLSFAGDGAPTINLVATLDFDGASVETAQFMIGMPAGFNGGKMTFIPVWSHGDTTVNFNVSWKLQGSVFRNNQSLFTVLGTAVESADTGGITDNLYIGPESPQMTLATFPVPGPGQYILFSLFRDPADSQDNMAVDARLHGIWLNWSTNMATDGLGVADGTPPP